MARIRPLLPKELDKDTIVRAERNANVEGKGNNVVRIPNPKNEGEEFSFAFNGVYDIETSQEELFTNEGLSSLVYNYNMMRHKTNTEQWHLISNLSSKASTLLSLHMV